MCAESKHQALETGRLIDVLFSNEKCEYKSRLFFVYLTLSASVSASGTLLCKVTEDFAGGWVPKIFLLALPTSEDYSDAEIILPKVHVISYAKWSKGWFQGSSEWKLEGLVKERM